jgi:hypothetical protein
MFVNVLFEVFFAFCFKKFVLYKCENYFCVLNSILCFELFINIFILKKETIFFF